MVADHVILFKIILLHEKVRLIAISCVLVALFLSLITFLGNLLILNDLENLVLFLLFELCGAKIGPILSSFFIITSVVFLLIEHLLFNSITHLLFGCDLFV